MPTQKLFKRRVRERMARTGESYTAARRQVAPKRDAIETARRRMASARELASDAKLLEVTGRGWDEWLAILDRWGAMDRRHAETAAHLVNDHRVPGWYAQAITNGYERARGIRIKHQQATGFTVYASRTVAVPMETLFDAFVDEEARSRWLTDGTMSLRSATRGKVARFDWGDGPTRVMVTFDARGESKTTASVAHERLPDADTAEVAKKVWRTRLTALKAFIESPPAP
jgi:uncharacterized protein YndB with AHSA1/START domain